VEYRLVEEIPTPTPRELEILKVLWDQGACSVRGVYRELIKQEPDLAYNTVQTMLRVMEVKRLVGHEQDGRTFIYTAQFSRDESTARFLDRVFDGAAAHLVQSLLESERISTEELEKMQRLIDEARKRRGKRGCIQGSEEQGAS
jgi:predicted transcriptional regulator